jgi:hypothetical protein
MDLVKKHAYAGFFKFNFGVFVVLKELLDAILVVHMNLKKRS